MKKTVVSIILFFFFFGISSAQDVNQFDENGERDGVWKKYYPNKRLRYEGEFKNGTEIGVFKFYSMNSSVHPMVTKTFSEESNEAKVQFFSSKGVIESEGMMLDKNRVGLWIYYHKDGRTIMIEENYVNGELSGDYKLYYKNTQLTKFSHYKNGMLHGNSKQYSDRGILIEDLNYVEGVLHGEAAYYETNGNLKQKGLYEDDLKIGMWEFYTDGKLTTSKEIKTPVKNGG